MVQAIGMPEHDSVDGIGTALAVYNWIAKDLGILSNLITPKSVSENCSI